MAQFINAFAHIPIDYLLIAGCFVVVAFDTFRSGAGRACALALSFPVSAILLTTLPSAAFVGAITAKLSTPVLQAVLFAVVFAIAYVLVHRIGVFYGNEAGRPLLAILAGLAGTAIVLAFWIHTPALQAVWQFSAAIHALFADSYRFWWLLGSYAALAFVRG